MIGLLLQFEGEQHPTQQTKKWFDGNEKFVDLSGRLTKVGVIPKFASTKVW